MPILQTTQNSGTECAKLRYNPHKVGLTLSTSNGLVEGKVNKLKLIKRMGYGRAAFPLLRQRVLHAL
jgi:transposase